VKEESAVMFTQTTTFSSTTNTGKGVYPHPPYALRLDLAPEKPINSIFINNMTFISVN
jgi:hypothetical protein